MNDGDGEADLMLCRPVGCTAAILSSWWLPALIGAAIGAAILFW